MIVSFCLFIGVLLLSVITGASTVMSVGGSGGFSVIFTFLWQCARWLLRFEVKIFAVERSFLPTQREQQTLMFLSLFTESNSK